MAQNIFQRFVSEANAVLKVAKRQSDKVLGHFGGYVRKTAQRSIRKRKGASPAGRPPHGHAQQLLKKFIFYAVNKNESSVIIGPARLNGTLGDAPHALESGGRSEVQRGTRARPRFETVNIPPRPYIGPAAHEAEKRLPSMWAQSRSK